MDQNELKNTTANKDVESGYDTDRISNISEDPDVRNRREWIAFLPIIILGVLGIVLYTLFIFLWSKP